MAGSQLKVACVTGGAPLAQQVGGCLFIGGGGVSAGGDGGWADCGGGGVQGRAVSKRVSAAAYVGWARRGRGALQLSGQASQLVAGLQLKVACVTGGAPLAQQEDGVGFCWQEVPWGTCVCVGRWGKKGVCTIDIGVLAQHAW